MKFIAFPATTHPNNNLTVTFPAEMNPEAFRFKQCMTKFRIIESPERAFTLLKLGLSRMGLSAFRINADLNDKNESPITFCVAKLPEGADIEYFSIAADEGGGSILMRLGGDDSSITHSLIMFWLRIAFDEVKDKAA